ncbi:hypothetical protein E2P81_ATG04898 [Venturia nashicola]|uniref:Uncharacterized protein n=1 Tax=Venturia nashicola TaxID=86259 RepID=A0A4Z1NZE1_9PEZI|nr:hypothetical protein E6O75_ATG05023 [Venturia nashicola]TLD34733.1 hypothetical protein E2P81_ATG04898 [Venturia nashicola]
MTSKDTAGHTLCRAEAPDEAVLVSVVKLSEPSPGKIGSPLLRRPLAAPPVLREGMLSMSGVRIQTADIQNLISDPNFNTIAGNSAGLFHLASVLSLNQPLVEQVSLGSV